MGLVSMVLSFARRGRNNDVKVNLGGTEVVQAEHFSPSGDDSPPLSEDRAYVGETQRSGMWAALGYLDSTQKVSEPGECRRYARSTEGSVVSVIHQRNDGSVEISNDIGTITLDPSGNIILNGVTIDPAGNLIATSLSAPIVTAGAVSLGTHTHSGGAVPPPDGGG